MKGRAWKNGILTLQKLDGVIHWINYYSVDKYLGHSNNCVIQLTVIYLVDNVIPVLKKLGRISL